MQVDFHLLGIVARRMELKRKYREVVSNSKHMNIYRDNKNIYMYCKNPLRGRPSYPGPSATHVASLSIPRGPSVGGTPSIPRPPGVSLVTHPQAPSLAAPLPNPGTMTNRPPISIKPLEGRTLACGVCRYIVVHVLGVFAVFAVIAALAVMLRLMCLLCLLSLLCQQVCLLCLHL